VRYNHHLHIKKQTTSFFIRKRTILTERPPVVGEFSDNFADKGVSRGQRGGTPMAVNLSFIDRSLYFSFK
jgi:hypothetical protein